MTNARPNYAPNTYSVHAASDVPEQTAEYCAIVEGLINSNGRGAYAQALYRPNLSEILAQNDVVALAHSSEGEVIGGVRAIKKSDLNFLISSLAKVPGDPRVNAVRLVCEAIGRVVDENPDVVFWAYVRCYPAGYWCPVLKRPMRENEASKRIFADLKFVAREVPDPFTRHNTPADAHLITDRYNIFYSRRMTSTPETIREARRLLAAEGDHS